MAYNNTDEKFMKQALLLAAKGIGYTAPNPAVGCVIVKDGAIIAGDYHHEAGKPHAEVLALTKAGENARDADLYATLEPCCIFGRTPPCTEAIIKAGIRRVIVGTTDPNPKVNGRGIKRLLEAGIEVTTDVLQARCIELNRGYNKYVATGLPLVTAKYAQSLDGRIATRSGSSQWISSPDSLKFAHKLRAEHNAIVVGANTANTDNPQLTVRLVKGKNPYRIILTKSGKLRADLKMLDDTRAPVMIATGSEGEKSLNGQLNSKAEILNIDDNKGGLDLRKMLELLGQKGITSLLIEGGAGTITSFLSAGLTDRIIIISAPIFIGDGINAIGDLHIRSIDKALKLINIKQKKIGPDCAVMGDLA